MAINKGEGVLFSALGFGGGKKPTGAKGDPLNVFVENMTSPDGCVMSPILNALTSPERGGGSFLGRAASAGLSLMGDAFGLPAFAAGGAIDAGTMSIVGEKGPELFMPRSSGTIIPNHKIGGMGGAGDTHLHIDARGATDPAQTEAAIHRAFSQYIPHIVAASVHAGNEQRMRKPSNIS